MYVLYEILCHLLRACSVSVLLLPLLLAMQSRILKLGFEQICYLVVVVHLFGRIGQVNKVISIFIFFAKRSKNGLDLCLVSPE